VVVDFVAILLKVPQEVSGAQAVLSRPMLLILLMVCWCCGCLHPKVVVVFPYVGLRTKSVPVVDG
jgi:hypothetical protein